MTRTLALSDEDVDEIVLAVLRNDLENIETELADINQHPEDERYCLFTRKALIRVINHFSPPSDKIPE